MARGKTQFTVFALLIFLVAFGAWWLWSNNAKIADKEERVVVGPYPEAEDFDNLKKHGVDVIVSLLDPNTPYEDTLLFRERAYAKEHGIRMENFSMSGSLFAAPDSAYDQNAGLAAQFVKNEKGKVYLHSYLTSKRTAAVEKLLKATDIAISTYTLPRGTPSESYNQLDSAHYKYQVGRFEESLQALEAVKHKGPPTYGLMGWNYYHLNNIDKAEENFVKALDMEKQNDDARIGLGYVAYRRDQLDKADSIFQSVLARHPRDPSSTAGMGLIRYKQNRLPEARDYITKSLKVDSINVEVGQILLRIDSALKLQKDTAKRTAMH